MCLVCNKPSIDGLTHPICRGKYTIDGSFASISYEGIAKKLIYTFKYQPYVSDIQTVLVDLLYEGLIQKEAVNNIFYRTPGVRFCFVPIPLHKDKLRERGYNQAAILASGLAKKFSLQTQNLLQRVKKTQSQKQLLSDARKKNIEGAFVTNKNCHPGVAATMRGSRQIDSIASLQNDRTIFLVDDIVTSGATFQEAAKTLKKAGYQHVYGLALARGR